MQNKIERQTDLLDQDGRLARPGYALFEAWNYERSEIRASALRIKEWDYYYVGNEHFGVALTIADNSYMGLVSASLLDFDTGFQETKSKIVPFTFGKFALPPSADVGETSYQSKQVDMCFRVDEDERHLRCHFHDFHDGQPLLVDVKLTDFPQDRMCIATPFAKPDTYFYFNQKINLMHATGYVQMGEKEYALGESPLDMGLLDWGRGVWTYKNTWYWSSLNTVLKDGRKFGFNLGYGFGDTKAATENMLFVDGIADKLEDVVFEIPKKEDGSFDYLSPWKFTSPDGRIDLTFTPILNRAAHMKVLMLESDQNQVFGKFSGAIRLSSGETVTLENAVGFAERVFNKW